MDLDPQGDASLDSLEDYYEVENILDTKLLHDIRFFKVRWKGYGSDDDTWEPEDHLASCQELLEHFWDRTEHTQNEKKTAKDGKQSPDKYKSDLGNEQKTLSQKELSQCPNKSVKLENNLQMIMKSIQEEKPKLSQQSFTLDRLIKEEKTDSASRNSHDRHENYVNDRMISQPNKEMQDSKDKSISQYHSILNSSAPRNESPHECLIKYENRRNETILKNEILKEQKPLKVHSVLLPKIQANTEVRNREEDEEFRYSSNQSKYKTEPVKKEMKVAAKAEVLLSSTNSSDSDSSEKCEDSDIERAAERLLEKWSGKTNTSMLKTKKQKKQAEMKVKLKEKEQFRKTEDKIDNNKVKQKVQTTVDTKTGQSNINQKSKLETCTEAASDLLFIHSISKHNVTKQNTTSNDEIIESDKFKNNISTNRSMYNLERFDTKLTEDMSSKGNQRKVDSSIDSITDIIQQDIRDREGEQESSYKTSLYHQPANIEEKSVSPEKTEIITHHENVSKSSEQPVNTFAKVYDIKKTPEKHFAASKTSDVKQNSVLHGKVSDKAKLVKRMAEIGNRISLKASKITGNNMQKKQQMSDVPGKSEIQTEPKDGHHEIVKRKEMKMESLAAEIKKDGNVEKERNLKSSKVTSLHLQSDLQPFSTKDNKAEAEKDSVLKSAAITDTLNNVNHTSNHERKIKIESRDFDKTPNEQRDQDLLVRKDDETTTSTCKLQVSGTMFPASSASTVGQMTAKARELLASNKSNESQNMAAVLVPDEFKMRHSVMQINVNLCHSSQEEADEKSEVQTKLETVNLINKEREKTNKYPPMVRKGVSKYEFLEGDSDKTTKDHGHDFAFESEMKVGRSADVEASNKYSLVEKAADAGKASPVAFKRFPESLQSINMPDIDAVNKSSKEINSVNAEKKISQPATHKTARNEEKKLPGDKLFNPCTDPHYEDKNIEKGLTSLSEARGEPNDQEEDRAFKTKMMKPKSAKNTKDVIQTTEKILESKNNSRQKTPSTPEVKSNLQDIFEFTKVKTAPVTDDQSIKPSNAAGKRPFEKSDKLDKKSVKKIKIDASKARYANRRQASKEAFASPVTDVLGDILGRSEMLRSIEQKEDSTDENNSNNKTENSMPKASDNEINDESNMIESSYELDLDLDLDDYYVDGFDLPSNDDDSGYIEPIHADDLKPFIVTQEEYIQAISLREYEKIIDGINNGINPDCCDANNGRTALWAAIEDTRYDVAKKLLKLGSNPNYRAENGKTALMIAVEEGKFGFVHMLLRSGAHINLQQHNGETALILACRTGREDIVNLLLNYGADVKITPPSNPKAVAEYSPEFQILLIKRTIDRYTERLRLCAENTLNQCLQLSGELLQPPLLPCRCISPEEKKLHDLYFKCDQNAGQKGINVLLLCACAKITPTGDFNVLMDQKENGIEAVILNKEHQIPVIETSRSLFFLFPNVGQINRLCLETRNSGFKLLVAIYAVKSIESWINTELDGFYRDLKTSNSSF